MQNHSYWKNFEKREKSDKKQEIFSCSTVSKFQEISTLNICDGSKQYFTLLEWFLLTTSKKYIPTRSTNPRSRNHSMLFLIKKRSADVQYLICNFMIRSTEAAIRRCSSK